MKTLSLTISMSLLLTSTYVHAEDVVPPPGRWLSYASCFEWDFVTDIPTEGYYIPDGTHGITNNWDAELEIIDEYAHYEFFILEHEILGAWVAGELIDLVFMEIRLPYYPGVPEEGRVQVTYDNRHPVPDIWIDHATGFFETHPVPGNPDWSVNVLNYELTGERNTREFGETLLVFAQPGTIVSEIVVDLVPEPHGLMYGFGGLLLLLRRRSLITA